MNGAAARRRAATRPVASDPATTSPMRPRFWLGSCCGGRRWSSFQSRGRGVVGGAVTMASIRCTAAVARVQPSALEARAVVPKLGRGRSVGIGPLGRNGEPGLVGEWPPGADSVPGPATGDTCGGGGGVRSDSPMPGNPWPHDMVIAVNDHERMLLELLFIRDAWKLGMADIPPLFPAPDIGRSRRPETAT